MENHERNMRLNIWWVSHYASTPDQQYTVQYDLARRLVRKGHRVTFFSAGFSHYKFKEMRLREGESWREEEHDGVRFVWIKTPPYKKNDWKRALNMCVFAWRAYWTARKLRESPDVIIGTTVHPLASLSAYGISVAKQRPFIFEVKDLWPLTIIQFGRLAANNPIARALSRLERFLACRAARIMTVLPGAAEYFSQFGIPKERIVWIPNGLDLSRYASLRPYSGQISGPCTLVYAGGHVQAFSLETVLRAAQIEQQNGNRARFVFVGGGQEKPKLMQLAQDLKLRNVEFRDAVPKSELYKVMEDADAFILSMQDLPELYRYGISFNKLCDYVAAGRPVLFAGNPSNNVVEEFQCGIVVPPQDPPAFAAAIRKFEEMTAEQRAEMGRNGIRCARERFDIATLAERLESMLISVANESLTPGESMRQPVTQNRHDRQAVRSSVSGMSSSASPQ
jgi:glycosyltransferase involved in cell wall biosynthesis